MLGSAVGSAVHRTRHGLAALVLLSFALMAAAVTPRVLSEDELIDALMRDTMDKEVTRCFPITRDFERDAQRRVCGGECGPITGFAAKLVAAHERGEYLEQMRKVRAGVKLRCPPDQPLC